MMHFVRVAEIMRRHRLNHPSTNQFVWSQHLEKGVSATCTATMCRWSMRLMLLHVVQPDNEPIKGPVWSQPSVEGGLVVGTGPERGRRVWWVRKACHMGKKTVWSMVRGICKDKQGRPHLGLITPEKSRIEDHFFCLSFWGGGIVKTHIWKHLEE